MKKISILFATLFFVMNITYGQDRINPEEYPYVFVVKLLMYKNGSTFHGTGVIIDQNNIITNAHNVYNKDSVHVFPGYSKKNNDPFGVIQVTLERDKTVFYPKEYETESLKNLYDFAVVKFNNNEVYNKLLQVSNGKKLELDLIQSLQNETLHIAGYPFFRWFEFWKPRKARVQYHNETKKFFISNDVILNYKMGTRKGSSGSPLWIEKDGKLVVIGIHKSGSGFKNQGIHYDSERFDLITKWIRQ